MTEIEKKNFLLQILFRKKSLLSIFPQLTYTYVVIFLSNLSNHYFFLKNGLSLVIFEIVSRGSQLEFEND